MLKKFLREVVVIIVGKQAEEIADLLDNKKYVNEFLIAKKLDITINQTRNILYKISDQGLVSSIRKKDKKKGWYTYFWKIEVLKSLEFLRNILLKKIGQINFQVKSRETKQFYVCERCNIEFNEENALLNDFTCNECGNVFVVKDNTKVLKEFKKNLERFKRELRLVEEEIEEEKQRLDKSRLKEINKQKKETAEKRKAKKIATKKLADKESKKGKKGKKLKKKVLKKKPKKKVKKKVGKRKIKKKQVKKKPARKKIIKKKKKKVTKKRRK